MYGLKTESAFDSAHFLADYYGKCENLHGHRYIVYIAVDNVIELRADGSVQICVLRTAYIVIG